MGLLKFVNLPVNTLVGADKKTFDTVTHSAEIDEDRRHKFVVTKRIRRMLGPFYAINEKRYASLSPNPNTEAPVFILGHWRSGTTFVHNVLSCDDSFGCCSTYQTVFPHLMLWGRPFFKRCMSLVMPSERPTDSMALGVDLPQEEEFALSNMTACAHYHFWMFPRRMAEYRDKYLTFTTATEAERQEFMQALDKLIRISLHVTGKKRFLSKNPPHTGRIKTLLELYPDAKFIYLVRNPYAVFESTRSFFRNTLASIRLQSISDEELEHEILLNYRALYEHYEADKPLVPEGHLIEVRFEEFESHPLETAKAIYQKLSLGDFEQVRPAMEHYLEGQRGFRKKTYHFDPKTRQAVEQYWGDALRQWDYRP